MTQFELQFFLILTYFSYVIAVIVFHSKIRNFYSIFAVLFVIMASILRLNIPIETNADFPVYNDFLSASYEFTWTSIFSEPFIYLAFKFIYDVFTTEYTLYVLYILNFICSLSFYIWVGCRKNIKPWLKIILFAITYILFTYTVLRNTPAYLSFGILIYYSLQKKNNFCLSWFFVSC
jgi:hypothetical protein